MGQDCSELYQPEKITEDVKKQLENRFVLSPHPVYSKQEEFKLLHEKLTHKKYALRVKTTCSM